MTSKILIIKINKNQIKILKLSKTKCKKKPTVLNLKTIKYKPILYHKMSKLTHILKISLEICNKVNKSRNNKLCSKTPFNRCHLCQKLP